MRILPGDISPSQTEIASQGVTRTDRLRTTPPKSPGRPRSDPGVSTGRERTRATSLRWGRWGHGSRRASSSSSASGCCRHAGLPLGASIAQLAGVEAGYACFCGSESDLARGRPAPATDCDQICFGHPGQLCGGDGRLGIYEVSVGSCQGNWTAPQGVLYSPDFPDEYGPDRNCSWALGPQGAALELTFRLFELADPRDRLELRDAASGSLLRAFDGARPPPPGPLRLRAAALLLTFRSDARGHGQGFALTYRGLPDAADSAPAPGSAQTPAAPLGGANVSGSPGPAAPEAGVGARALPTLAAVPALLLLLPLLSLLRRRSCLPAPREGRPALGPPGGPGRSWAVWYRQPRGAAMPCPPGDPQAEGLAASYRPLSASSQSSLRSLISAL